MKSLVLALPAVALLLSVQAATATPLAVKAGFGVIADTSIDKRRKPRIKGGSGCDDAGDAVEHPECR